MQELERAGGSLPHSHLPAFLPFSNDPFLIPSHHLLCTCCPFLGMRQQLHVLAADVRGVCRHYGISVAPCSRRLSKLMALTGCKYLVSIIYMYILNRQRDHKRRVNHSCEPLTSWIELLAPIIIWTSGVFISKYCMCSTLEQWVLSPRCTIHRVIFGCT